MTLEEIFKEEDTSTNIFGDVSSPLKTETKPKKEMEKTLEIETLDLNVYLDKNEKIEKPITEKPKVEAPASKDTPKEENEEEKDYTIQESFINCSVLAFITAFIGAGWLINIINHI